MIGSFLTVIGPIMLNFYVSFVVNQNKLLRNSRIAGDMRRRDSCDATVLEVPQQINGQNFSLSH